MTDLEHPRVLVVDDDPEVVDLAERRLRQYDDSFDVVGETDPEEALDILEGDVTLDCVVSDYRMDGMTGIDLLQHVRERDEYLPFVLLTGRGGESVASDAISAGVTRYIQKGVGGGFDDLAAAVSEAVDLYHERKAVREELTLIESIFESTEDLVVVVDSTGRLIYCNETARRLTGFGDAPQSYLDLLPESEHERVRDAISTALETGEATVRTYLETKDGPVPYEFTGTALPIDDDVVCGIGRDISEHRRYEETLESLLAVSRALLTASSRREIADVATEALEIIADDPLGGVYFAHDDRLDPVSVTSAVAARLDGPPAYELGEGAPVPRAFATGDSVRVDDVEEIDDGRNRAPLGQELVHPLSDEGVLVFGLPGSVTLSQSDRHLVEILAANTTAALRQQATETDLREREATLRTLHTKTRELMQTTTRADIAAVVADAAENMLDLPAVSVFFWDARDGCLRPVSVSDDAKGVDDYTSKLDSSDGIAWDAFTSQETRIHASSTDAADALGSELAVPLGSHGVLVSGSSPADQFHETTVEFAELLASNATVALDRTERERRLLDQESMLQHQNELLERLNRINTTIRDINSALVDAQSVSDVRRAVCEKLTATESYAFAWIGHETGDGDVVLDAWGGEGRGFLDHLLANPDDERTAFSETVRTGEATVVDNLVRDDRFAPWRKPAINRGFQSVACLPLTWRDHDYGFLEIYATRPDVFDDDEVAVLEELTADIANAISAIKRKTALVSGQSTELVLRFEDIDDPLFELARRTGVRLRLDGILPKSDGSWSVYVEVPSSSTEAVLDACDQFVRLSDATVVRTDDDSDVVCLTVSDFSLIETFSNHGASVQTVELDADFGVVTLTVPPSTDVRAFVDSCTSSLGDLSLVRREMTDRPTSTNRLRYDLQDLVTDKQFEALKAGYFDGYFDVPREHTGEEMAAKMDVSGPTYQHHVRKGLQRILRVIFERTSE